VQATPGETLAAAMQLAIALLTAGLDSPELETWAADALTPNDADGLGDFMAGLHVTSVLLLHELHEATGEPSAAVLQRLAMMAERQPGDTVGWLRHGQRSRQPCVRPPAVAVNNRNLLFVLVDEPSSGLSSWVRSDVRSATVTADLYATATGLIERSAAAYAGGCAGRRPG
jgi:hypothetical protein